MSGIRHAHVNQCEKPILKSMKKDPHYYVTGDAGTGRYVNKVHCDIMSVVKIKKRVNNHNYMYVKNINDNNSKIQNKQNDTHKI